MGILYVYWSLNLEFNAFGFDLIRVVVYIMYISVPP